MLNIGIGESNVRHLDEIILENETLGRGNPLNTVSEACCNLQGQETKSLDGAVNLYPIYVSRYVLNIFILF